LEAGSVPPSLDFPQLDFVKPSSGFHPVTSERVKSEDGGEKVQIQKPMEKSSPVFGFGVGEEEEEYATAVQGCSSSSGFTHEGSVSELFSLVQQESPEREKTLEEEDREEEEEEQEEGNSY